ncbi:MAG TPA: O-antigen ligase C-terminal domain-containing protein [Candidatus Aquabacterium excrementipullorum]|nr:O-antigen ligase C-terminal domain-containing protein [Candidatus Aquabacterium excrementipullorum]
MTMRAMTENLSPARAPALPGLGLPLALLALLVPTLLAASQSPSITFYNQALGVFGWGVWMTALAWWTGRGDEPRLKASGPLQGLSVVLWMCAGSALGSVWATGLPLGLGLMAAGLSLSAWLVMWTAWRAAHRIEVAELMDLVCAGLAWAGVAGLVLAVIQVFVPQLADGTFIAESTTPGRAVGNLRQPNHFSTLLFWSVCGVAWLGRRGRWPMAAAQWMVVLFIGVIVWTASRTGMLAMLLLSLWAWRDRGLPRSLRWLLAAAPLVYGAWWLGMSWWSHAGEGHAFAAEARLHDGSDISSSRFKIWADTWSLIRANPWTGVGWGEFNLAWTFTEFPNRPIAFFDHTHNLVLQWMVELGIPLAVLLLALCAWAVWVLWWPGREGTDAVVPAAATMVSMAGLHSLLEYPLWYSYFLLPTAFVWGLGLAARAGVRAEPPVPASARQDESLPTGLLNVALAALLVLGAAWAAIDYQWAVNIYAPRAGAGPLEERIRHGQNRLWFGYQADYADATGPEADEPSKPPQAFRRTLHNLVDARLMIAYARSLAEHGQVDQARYVVQRLQEFHNPMGQAFLAICQKPEQLQKLARRPFQCDPPQGRYTWRQVLPR